MTTITTEAYVEMLMRRLEAIQTTAGEALNESRRHGWSKNLGVKDTGMVEKMQRDLSHIISYAAVMQTGGENDE